MYIAPPLQPFFLGRTGHVFLDEGEKPLEQDVAGRLEGGERALKAFEEQGANEADHLLLAADNERIELGFIALVERIR